MDMQGAASAHFLAFCEMTSANKPMQINLYDQLLTIWNELAGA
jgi:hypothetical protein